MALPGEIKRRNGNLEAILDGMISDNPIFKLQAICGAVNNNVFNKAIKTQLERLTKDGEVVIGYSISQLAIAALDRLADIRYEGRDQTIIELIKSRKWFEYN